MILTVPVLVEEIRHAGRAGRGEHRLEPLFMGEPRESDSALGRGLSNLMRAIERRLDRLCRAGEHAEAAAYGFFPDVSIKSFALRLDLRRGPVRVVVPVVMFPRWSRLLAFLPDARDVWFQLDATGDHAERVNDVLTRVFREFEQKLDAADVDALLERLQSPRRRLSIQPVSVWFDPRQDLEKADDDHRSAVTAEQKFHGSSELAAVGRCLDDLYPDRLDRSFGRDDSVAELDRLLALADTRPVALVGPRLVGKTALLHEVIRRRAEAEAAGLRPSREGTAAFWTVPPQRLIAGMSHLGQWEQRLLAILGFVEQRRHVLVIDDVLGLYRAGQSAGSRLCVADVLRPWILGRRVRVVAELTPEQLRVLAERDRGLADAFHVVRIAEPPEDETLGIVLETVSYLESRYGARFAPDAVAAALTLTHRYRHGTALPGKVIRLLADLAVRNPAPRQGLAIDPWIAAAYDHGGEWGRDPAAETAAVVDRQAVLRDFGQRSGLVPAFVDEQVLLPRGEVVAGLRRLLVGQDAAVAAIADVVSLAKAGLNDPDRPLGSLLLVGPTGVGKTQAAKALAAVLFGDPARLLRFDMNEFASGDAAARLAGTFARPEGLLTAAVRRQPFCIVLFDEIEKAHPDVFDLLLQVLGEARLTDANGRTTDFSNAVILLTSNLGSREAARGLGFGGEDTATADIHRRAVVDFFRPEFINRLDHIVVFEALSRAQMAGVAARVLDEVLGREGLARRRCILDVASEALDWVVARGYDRALGARAMKRAVERDLVQPVARHLAASAPELPTIITIRPHPSAGVATRVVSLEQAVGPARQPEIASLTPEDFSGRVEATLDRLSRRCRDHRPEAPASIRDVSAEYAWYLGLTEQIAHLRREHAESHERRTGSGGALADRQPRIAGLQRDVRSLESSWRGVGMRFRDRVREVAAAADIGDYFRELAAVSPPEAAGRREAFVRGTLARLELMIPGQEGWHFDRALIVVRGVVAGGPERQAVRDRISAAITLQHVGFDAEWHGGEEAEGGMVIPAAGGDHRWWNLVTDEAALRRHRRALRLDAVVLSGQRAVAFAERLQGTYLMGTEDGRILPVLVTSLPIDAGRTPGDVLTEALAAHEAAASAEAADEADPLRWRPVVEIAAAGGFRALSWDDFLPLPAEFAE